MCVCLFVCKASPKLLNLGHGYVTSRGSMVAHVTWKILIFWRNVWRHKLILSIFILFSLFYILLFITIIFEIYSNLYLYYEIKN